VVASQEADVMAPVRQFVDGFNKSDIKMAQGACADETFIIDDFPPHEWRGSRATSKWFHDLAALGKKYDMSDPFVTLGKPRQVHVTGTHALAADGTIWTWGSIPITSQGATRLFALPFPTRISSETNWIGFASGFAPLLRSRTGEIWSPFVSIPNPNASVSSICTLVVSNSLLNGIAAAVTDSNPVTS